MNNNNLTIQFYNFLISQNLDDEIELLFKKAIASRALNIEDEPVKSNRLVRIIYHAILSELTSRVKPQKDSDLVESENLQRFL